MWNEAWGVSSCTQGVVDSKSFRGLWFTKVTFLVSSSKMFLCLQAAAEDADAEMLSGICNMPAVAAAAAPEEAAGAGAGAGA